VLAWVVIDRRQFTRSGLRDGLHHPTSISFPLRVQRLCVKFSDSFPPSFHFISQLPYTLPSSVSRKSFACRSYENCRGVYQQFPFWNPWNGGCTPSRPTDIQTFKRFDVLPAYPLSFHILPHSFALTKIQLFSFQVIPNSLQKTTRGGGGFTFRNCPAGSILWVAL
jgi:hypothetical protein